MNIDTVNSYHQKPIRIWTDIRLFRQPKLNCQLSAIIVILDLNLNYFYHTNYLAWSAIDTKTNFWMTRIKGATTQPHIDSTLCNSMKVLFHFTKFVANTLIDFPDEFTIWFHQPRCRLIFIDEEITPDTAHHIAIGDGFQKINTVFYICNS